MHRYLVLLLTAGVTAQNPALTPTGHLVLDTNATQGHFAFSRIDIPVGVRVRFTGTHPVQIRCDGDAVIRGQLDVDALSNTGGPGSVTTGAGSPGVSHCWYFVPAGHGTHAGVYGSALPFSLAGGSPGGDRTLWWNGGLGSCTQGGTFPGGGGGGTLVLEAAGRIDVHGRVSANGDPLSQAGGMTVGSGGALLLRGLAGVTIHATGLVQATANPNLQNAYPPGIIRIDSYVQAPVVAGTVDPPAFILTQPHLEETQPPIIGNTWQLLVVAPRGNAVTLAASFLPGSTTNQFGSVGIDLPTAILFAFAAMPGTGHDPRVTYQLALPNDPGLVGLNLYVAGLNWLTTLPPRYTNTIATSVQ